MGMSGMQSQDNQHYRQQPKTSRSGAVSYGDLMFGVGAPSTIKVSKGKLSSAFKSKADIYAALTVKGQLYLPPFNDCSMDFISAIMRGKKKVRFLCALSLRVSLT